MESKTIEIEPEKMFWDNIYIIIAVVIIIILLIMYLCCWRKNNSDIYNINKRLTNLETQFGQYYHTQQLANIAKQSESKNGDNKNRRWTCNCDQEHTAEHTAEHPGHPADSAAPTNPNTSQRYAPGYTPGYNAPGAPGYNTGYIPDRTGRNHIGGELNDYH
jgi:hypothetical protein